MNAAIYVNRCGRCRYVDKITSLEKPFETRGKNTLAPLIGARVYIIETGRKHSQIRCSAVIKSVSRCRSRSAWDRIRSLTCVPEGSRYDWTDSTTCKYIYHLTDVQPVSAPFPFSVSVSHGRSWCEIFTEEGVKK